MYYESEYLQHHGIKGQRWGVRRYQNADGTYTKAGLARYNKAKADLDSARKKYELEDSKYNRKTYRAAKKQEKAAYKALKRSGSADRGYTLYLGGATNKKIEKQLVRQTTLTGMLGGSASCLAMAVGAPALGTALVAGTVATSTVLRYKSFKKSVDLNNYYREQRLHSGMPS